MSKNVFIWVVTSLGLAFAVLFLVVFLPALIENPDFSSAGKAGFVNPFASTYTLDAIFCWLVLISWVVYEAKVDGIRHGWICILLGAVPGVATGLAAYLILRLRQQTTNSAIKRQRNEIHDVRDL